MTTPARAAIITLIIALLVTAGVGAFYYTREAEETPTTSQTTSETSAEQSPPLNSENELVNSTNTTTLEDAALAPVDQAINESALITNDVPFTAQAPFGNWNDQRQQQGCEEASLLMAMRWVQEKPITQQEALNEIFAMAAFQQQRFGFYHDTNVDDTLTLLKEYFDYENAEAKHDITPDDIITELRKGALVIIPVNGQKLENPFYTPPGPLRHMMVITGYDLEKEEFIVNDPGTRNGHNIRYTKEIIQGALQEYPSGIDLPITDQKQSFIAVYR